MSTGLQTTPVLDTPSQELAPTGAQACPGLECAARPLQPLGAKHLFALRRRGSLSTPRAQVCLLWKQDGGVSRVIWFIFHPQAIRWRRALGAGRAHRGLRLALTPSSEGSAAPETPLTRRETESRGPELVTRHLLLEPGGRDPSPSSLRPRTPGTQALPAPGPGLAGLSLGTLSSAPAGMPRAASHSEHMEAAHGEHMESQVEEEGLGGLTAEELRQGQEAARALEARMALSAQSLVRAEVDELYEHVRALGQGRFGRVSLVTHRQEGTRAWSQGTGAGGLQTQPVPPLPFPGGVFLVTAWPSLNLSLLL